jgi:serine/threonine-protein kinase
MVASKHVLEQPTPPSKLNRDVAPALEAVIMKALSKNPDNRYQDADEMRADLERARLGQPVQATPLLPETARTRVIAPSGPPTAVLPPVGPEDGERRRWWIPVLILLLILAVLGGGLYLLASSLLSTNTAPVKVPDVRGFTQDAATRTLTEADFKVKPEFQVTTNQADVGDVISQDPLPGTLLEKGKTVTITVGKAPARVEVPDLTGLTQDEADAALKAANLKLGTPVTTQPSDQPEGTVVSQDPPARQQAAKGSPVNIVLSSGPGQVTVPDVRCESFSQAKKDLKDNGLNAEISPELVAINLLCPNGNKVADQSPQPGQQAPEGSTVTLYAGGLSPSPSPTPTPSE